MAEPYKSTEKQGWANATAVTTIPDTVLRLKFSNITVIYM